MRHSPIFKAGLVTLLLIIGILAINAPAMAAAGYDNQATTFLTNLRNAYQKAQVNDDLSAAKQAAELAPFVAAKKDIPSLLPIGFLAPWDVSYKSASTLHTDITTFVDKGADYAGALQQKSTFLDDFSKALKNVGTSPATADITSSAYRTVAALRQKDVTSPLLADSTKQYVSTMNHVADLYAQVADGTRSGDMFKVTSAQTELSRINLTLLVLQDTPKGLSDWRSSAREDLDNLIARAK